MTQDDAVGERVREHKQDVLPWKVGAGSWQLVDIVSEPSSLDSMFYLLLFVNLHRLKAYNEKNRLGGRTLQSQGTLFRHVLANSDVRPYVLAHLLSPPFHTLCCIISVAVMCKLSGNMGWLSLLCARDENISWMAHPRIDESRKRLPIWMVRAQRLVCLSNKVTSHYLWPLYVF